jgi:hypothetical protein
VTIPLPPTVYADDPPKPIDQKAVVEIRLQIEDLKAEAKRTGSELNAAAAPQPALPVYQPGRLPNDSGAATEPSLSPPPAQEEPQEKNGVPVSSCGCSEMWAMRSATKKAERNSFHIGTLDLLMAGVRSERVSILGEVLFIPRTDNTIEADVERLLLQYRRND